MVRKLIILSSDFGISGSVSHDFTIKLEEPLDLTNTTHYLSLISADLWYSFYNIDSTVYNNNIFRYFNGTIYHDIIIPDGQYSFDDLINVINAGMFANGDYSGTASDPVYNIVLSPNYNTGRVDVSISAGYKIDFTTSELYVIFGCDQVEYSASFTSPSKGNITNGINSLHIGCSLVSGNAISGGGTASDTIATLTPNTAPNSHINFQPKLNNKIVISQSRAQQIRVTIRDQVGRLVDLEGEPVSITCYISDK